MRPAHPAPGPDRRPPAGATAVKGALALTLVLLLAVAPAPAGGVTRSATDPATTPSPVSAAPFSALPSPSGYVLPVPGPTSAAGRPTRAELLERGVLVRDFVDPGPRWGAGHRGVDLAAAAGAPVVAPAAGTVSFVGVVVDRPLIVITHHDGLRSTLEPVTSDLATGSRVGAGERVGSLAPEASTHCAPATCLHWGVRRGEVYLDPLVLLGAAEAVILLPRG